MSTIRIGKATNTIVINGSVQDSTVSNGIASDIFAQIQAAALKIDDPQARSKAAEVVSHMKSEVGQPGFLKHYRDFVELAANHVTALGPFVELLKRLFG